MSEQFSGTRDATATERSAIQEKILASVAELEAELRKDVPRGGVQMLIVAARMREHGFTLYADIYGIPERVVERLHRKLFVEGSSAWLELELRKRKIKIRSKYGITTGDGNFISYDTFANEFLLDTPEVIKVIDRIAGKSAAEPTE